MSLASNLANFRRRQEFYHAKKVRPMAHRELDGSLRVEKLILVQICVILPCDMQAALVQVGKWKCKSFFLDSLPDNERMQTAPQGRVTAAAAFPLSVSPGQR